MSRGILPRPQQWRREPSTALCKEAEQPPVPLDYYILMTRNWYELLPKISLQVAQVWQAQGRGFWPSVTCSVRFTAPTATIVDAEAKIYFRTISRSRSIGAACRSKIIEGGASVS